MTASTAPGSVPLVEVEGLSVAYRRHRVVDGLSFRIDPGASYGLVGESGSGKSTAAGTLTASLGPDATTTADVLRVDGVDVTGLRRDALRRFRRDVVAVVHQEPGLALDPTMPVGRQVSEVLTIRGVRRAEAERSTTEAFARVGLPTPDTIGVRYPHELSGGQQQRVAIAMALVARPRLLVLDEPTTGLDSTVEAEIMALVDDLRAELGFATLLISHNLPLVAAHCDRVGVLRDGQLVEEGTARQVITAPEHGYTRQLVDALPDLGRTGARDSHRASRPGADAAASRATSDDLVVVRGLRKTYDEVAALDGIDLEVHRGEVLGVVGESGSGKTTFGRALAGLVTVDGEVVIDRSDAGTVPPVQVVFQNADASLNPRRTVRQVLTRAIRLLSGSGTAADLAARVGLGEEVLDRRPAQLSGGQKQRVAIARAFAGPVPLVVCDEPTSALDVSVQAVVLDLLLRLQRETGTTCVFISHDLAVVRRVADRVAVFADGQVVDVAPTEDVFTRSEHPHTRRLVAAAVDLRRRAGLLPAAAVTAVAAP